MASFRRVNVHQSIDRVLLTEVAPFELPPNLTNTGFFAYVRKTQMSLDGASLSWLDRGNPADSYLALLIAGTGVHSDVISTPHDRFELNVGKATWKLPYRFWVRKSDGQKRTLSLPHPLTQLGIVAFYRAYFGLLAFHSSRSKFSLRHPERVSTFSFALDRLHAYQRSRRREGIETFGEELEVMSSFFRYRRYSNINKFYESKQFHRMEARFPFQRRLDITRCFESLYTHSVDWAIRGHHASKHGIGEDVFSTKLDKLFQSANNGQTNGVIVGPEFSRIFAEIILQSVDLAVQATLVEGKLIFGQDYWVGRYVDDYFIFCSGERDAAVIQEHIEIQLEKFNLRLNRSKQVDFSGPSFSPIHTAKQRMSRMVSRFYKRAEGCVDDPVSTSSMPDIDLLISGYKSTLHGLAVKPSEINNFVLGVMEKRIARLLRMDHLHTRLKGERLARLLRDSVALTEFLYSASASVPSALRASRLMLQCIRFAGHCGLDRDLQLSVRAEVDRACIAIIGRHNLEEPTLAGAERLYWLLLQAELGRKWLMSEDSLRLFIKQSGGANYLLIVTALQYMQDRKRYAGLRAEICDRVEEFIGTLRPQAAERMMLQADLIACPYVETSRKIKWMAGWFPNQSSAENLSAIGAWPTSVFAEWSGFDLERSLRAKKSHEVY